MSNSRTTYILLGVLLLLIAATFLLVKGDDPQQVQLRQQAYLWDYSGEDVELITIRQYNGKTLELRHRSTVWEAVTGTTGLLDSNAVSATSKKLLKLTTASKFVSGDLSKYGLAGISAPRAVISLTLFSGQVAAVLVGDNLASSKGDDTGAYIADAASPNTVATNLDNAVRSATYWLIEPPLAATPVPTLMPSAAH